MFKPIRKHDKVRKLKDENEKLTRIESDLMYSNELKIVIKPMDTEEFEQQTNRDFNRNFDNELYEMLQDEAIQQLSNAKSTQKLC